MNTDNLDTKPISDYLNSVAAGSMLHADRLEEALMAAIQSVLPHHEGVWGGDWFWGAFQHDGTLADGSTWEIGVGGEDYVDLRISAYVGADGEEPLYFVEDMDLRTRYTVLGATARVAWYLESALDDYIDSQVGRLRGLDDLGESELVERLREVQGDDKEVCWVLWHLATEVNRELAQDYLPYVEEDSLRERMGAWLANV